eukprot:24645_5
METQRRPAATVWPESLDKTSLARSNGSLRSVISVDLALPGCIHVEFLVDSPFIPIKAGAEKFVSVTPCWKVFAARILV